MFSVNRPARAYVASSDYKTFKKVKNESSENRTKQFLHNRW
jgi:hypothetical protein